MNAKWLCALLLLGCENRADSCRQALSEYRVSVFRDSTVRGEQLQGGNPTGCEDLDVQSVAGVLARSLATVPAQERRPLRVHLEVGVADGPPVLDMEVHASGALLVNQAPADETIWLHEYFHTLAGHPKGKDAFVTRSLRAIEEGAADYFAATFAQTHQVGSLDGREVRDLADPKRAGERLWLLFAQGKAGPHTLGLSFARELWAERGADSELALALAACLRSGAAAAPLLDARELANFCPTKVSAFVSRSIKRWMLRDPSQPQRLAFEET